MSIPGRPLDISRVFQEWVQSEKQSASPRPAVQLSPEDRIRLQSTLLSLIEMISSCTRLCGVLMHLGTTDVYVKEIIHIVSL